MSPGKKLRGVVRGRRPSRSYGTWLLFAAMLVILVAFISQLMANTDMKTPIAKRISHTTTIHGDTRADDYHWLRDSAWPQVTDPAILDYLREENVYFASQMASEKELSEKIFQELKGRIQEDDDTPPYKDGNYWYYSRIREGQQYWVYLRKALAQDAKEEIVLDVNQLAMGKEYASVRSLKLSPDHTKLAYTADFDGSERYTIYVIDIATRKVLDKTISDIMGNIEWDELGKGLFYTPAGNNWRPKQVYYHELGHEQSDDKLLYQEAAETFTVVVHKSSSKKYIYIEAQDAETNEYHLINSKYPTIAPRLFEPRRNKHLYYPEHHEDQFYILTNDTHRNFRLAVTDEAATESKHWKEKIAPSNHSYLVDLNVYKHHMTLTERVLGLATIHVTDLRSQESQTIEFPDLIYEAGVMYTTFDADGVRYSYSSLVEPDSVIELNFSTGEKNVLKKRHIPSGYNKAEYHLERIWADAPDGTAIPISLVYRRDQFKKDGSNPLYLYGYGSYGIAMPTNFRSSILSLLDRGFIYAIAHVRGGDELGYEWYESAKFLTKKHTFEDFISAAEYLADQQYTKRGNIVIAGGSAGGMLMGVCANMRPELYKAVVAHVPFVDVLNTMLDDTLPLTPGEFVEWGNPKDKRFYDYIKSYSPYDNITEQYYPHFLITAGISDPRVAYWEPAKWAAKLRAHKKDNNLLLLKTDMSAGHKGPTGRYHFLQEIVTEYAFILKVFGLDQ